MTTTSVRPCECCSEGEIAHVAASAVGPVSFGFCNECLVNNAEPEWTLEYLYTEVGTEGEGLADWVENINTYKDGRYWTWSEWKEWRRAKE